MHVRIAFISSFAALAAIPVGCTDEGEDDTGLSTSSATSGPSTGSGSSTSSAAGGAGGAGGEGGGAACLPGAMTAAYFTIQGDELCAVERVDAEALVLTPYGTTPTWGRHGGPLTLVVADPILRVQRWTASGSSLSLSAEDAFPAPMVPSGAFWGPMVVDAMAATEEVSVAAWTGANFQTEGGLVVMGNDNSVSVGALGVFGLGARGSRLLWTGISPAGSTTAGPAAMHRGGVGPLGMTFDVTDDGTVAAWADATGPLVFDAGDNAFAVMTALAGTQELRGFAAADIEAGDPPTAGVTLGTLDGFGDALAAVAPAGSDPGLVVMQPNDGTSFAHLDVVAIPYSIDAGAIVAAGGASTLLALATADTNVTLMTDDTGRLWVGAANAEGGMGSVFFVLDRP
jgi:hypothetical protein